MKERMSFAGVPFLGCKTWRKCGRHRVESGKLYSDAEWNKLIETEQTEQQKEMQKHQEERSEHERNVELALRAMIIKYGEVIKKVQMMDVWRGNGQSDVFLSKEDLKLAKEFPEPCFKFQHKDGGLVVSLIDYATVCCHDWFSDGKQGLTQEELENQRKFLAEENSKWLNKE
jgi:hypothetical protein